MAMDIIGMYMGGSLVAGAAAWLINQKILKKAIFFKTVKNTSIALGVIGLVGVNTIAGAVGGAGFSSSSVSGGDAPTGTTSQLFASEDFNINGTQTGLDFYNSDDTSVTIYATDSNYPDDQWLNGTINLERSDSSGAESIKLECTSSDFTHTDGTTKNLVSKDSLNQIELKFSGAGRHSADNTVYVMTDFAEGTSSVTKSVQIKLDEAGHDALQSYDSKSILCKAGGRSVDIEIVNNE